MTHENETNCDGARRAVGGGCALFGFLDKAPLDPQKENAHDPTIFADARGIRCSRSIRRGTPNESLSRTHFGDELDFIAKYSISPRTNILFGYSHFWRGDKILAPRDADFFYTQWEMNF